MAKALHNDASFTEKNGAYFFPPKARKKKTGIGKPAEKRLGRLKELMDKSSAVK